MSLVLRTLRRAQLIVLAMAGVVALYVGAQPAAAAASQGLIVTNLGQTGLESLVPQPPQSVAARGSCVHPRTVADASSGGSLCPPGTWPAPGGDWSPTIAVAAGDQLRLTFSDHASSVQVTITSNYEAGLTTPDGTPVPNFDAGPVSVQPTDNPNIWVMTVPALDLRFSGAGGAMGITAVDEHGAGANFAMAVALPRWSDYSIQCGTAFYSPTDIRSLCPAHAAPPGLAPNPTPTPASSGIRFVTSPHLVSHALASRVRIPATGTLHVHVTSRKQLLYRHTITIKRAGDRTLRFRLPRRTERRVRKALSRGDLAVQIALGATRLTWRSPPK